MIRFLNILALIAVIGSATWAYSVKYETILVAEKLRKREVELGRERDAVMILQAEWQVLNRPVRLQALAAPEGGMQSISARQVALPADIPLSMPNSGDKLDALLTGSIPTPDSARKSATRSGTTPSTSSTTTKASTRPPGAARTTARTTARTQTTPGSQVPLRLVPPAKIGPQPKTEAAAPVAENAAASNPLAGFLKKLLR